MVQARDDIRSVRQRKYLAREFDGFRAQLLEYARVYYPDKLKDLSEMSMGGLLMDMAAYVGDNLSFYQDHQFQENFPESAVETTNIERHLRNAGVPIVGAAPAIAALNAFVEIQAVTEGNSVIPDTTSLPIVLAGSVFGANNGTNFLLMENIDFTRVKSDGSLAAEIKVATKTPAGSPASYILSLPGLCMSGREASETFSVGETFVPFKKISLGEKNISEVISVIDGLGNVYYEVSNLSNDVVYRNVLNTTNDNDIVKDAVRLVPAPYRFTRNVDLATRLTTLTFGGGNADTLEDDVIPDPADFAISFPYSRTFDRISINPNQLLQTKTLGVAAANTTYTVIYRHGGGLSHNVGPDTIRNVVSLQMSFPNNPSPVKAGRVRSSTEVTNRIRASGGDDAPTPQTLKELIPLMAASQGRIVTKEDMLARVYTLPANFGRVFRAAVRSNPNNPLASQLFIISRDQSSRLITSPDTLKINLIKYLSPYRSISDAIDVLDARVIDLTLDFSVLIDASLNKNTVLQGILSRLKKFFNIKNWHIDQPIVYSDVRKLIHDTQGVISVEDIKFANITGTINNRTYSDNTFDIGSNTTKGILIPPSGGIFEIKFPDIDLVGTAL
jgi:hypothetical protein